MLLAIVQFLKRQYQSTVALEDIVLLSLSVCQARGSVLGSRTGGSVSHIVYWQLDRE